MGGIIRRKRGEMRMLENIKRKLSRGKSEFILYSPCDGDVVELEDVEDEVFASGMLGKGVGIVPKEGRIYSPTSGTVTNVFDTGHAMNIMSDYGCELLIHIGLDTVTLGKKYFDVKVKVGDRVNKEELLCEFDIDGIKEAGLKTTTPMVVCNSDDFSEIIVRPDKTTRSGDSIIRIIK